mmetsp:Transcript_54937/g.133421  ORF Transcript_54937/g.133421 Transcript_54937/m.133421 type:complete len:901 (-) Transcript_54937:23-2725(-)
MFVARRAICQCVTLIIPALTFQTPKIAVRSFRRALVVQRQPVIVFRTRSCFSTASTTTDEVSSEMPYHFDGDVPPSLLARAWTHGILYPDDKQSNSKNQKSNYDSDSKVTRAIQRAIPLLQESESVPFVCRYRTDVIQPLTTKQVHLLHTYVSRHASLLSMRKKLMGHLSLLDDDDVKHQVLTSVSKTELDDLYAPFKPPSKGSILERIQSENPELVEAVDNIWNSEGGEGKGLSLKTLLSNPKKYPVDSIIYLLGTKIAAEPKITSIVWDEVNKHCRLKTSLVSSSSRSQHADTYRNYEDFSMLVRYLKDHHVLAIRRGVDQKAIKMAYEIDGTKMERCIRHHLMDTSRSSTNHSIAPDDLKKRRDILKEAVNDAWKRLLRRRATTRLWSEKCKTAQERSCEVFQDNLRRAMLAPPRLPPRPVLSLDPGFKAGIKCAVLEDDGKVSSLDTVKFLGNQRGDGVQKLIHLLETTKMLQGNKDAKVLVALGNGHGSQDCRKLVQEASAECNIPIEVELVNEAGASVWSVTETALQEFPMEQPAAIASVSIGRRLQNPLFELVKVPPKSLGLGMYQHDLPEKDLDDRLHLTSVDAVATVGVDLNSSSLQILQKVPGLKKLAEKVAKARPFKRRQDLLKTSGLGPKTYENCAGFLRIADGPEPLDNTLVHPESYDISKSLLKALSWNLEKPQIAVKQIESLPRHEWGSKFEDEVVKTSKKFGVNKERTIAILENLIDSMLKKDPRLEDGERTTTLESDVGGPGSVEPCSLLSPELAENMDRLQAACPVRNIIGNIRNIADFGAFIDFGGENDGLLHQSQLGPLKLSNLLIGQQIGIDILQVENRRISLGVSGLNLQPRPILKGTKQNNRARSNDTTTSGSKRSMSTKKASAATVPAKKKRKKNS